MKATLNRNELRRLAGAFHGLLPRRTKNLLPILTNVLIEMREGGIYVTGTDLDTWSTVRLEGEVLEPCSICVPLGALRNLARVLPAGTVELDLRSAVRYDRAVPMLVLSQGEIRFELEGEMPDEFPQPDAFEPSHEITVPAADLFRLYGAVGFAVCGDEYRPTLRGVQWETHDGRLQFCATNGHRLATMEASADVRAMPEMIVQRKAFHAARKLFDADAELRVTRSADRIAIEAGEQRVVSRLIEGPYPNWRAIVPKESASSAICDRAVLQRTIDRALVVADRSTRRITFFVGATGAEEAWLAAESETVGKYGARIELAEAMEGPAITIGLNAGYATEVLKHLPTDQVRMHFNRPENAILLQPVGDDAPSMTVLLMPLRIPDEMPQIPWARAERKVAW